MPSYTKQKCQLTMKKIKKFYRHCLEQFTPKIQRKIFDAEGNFIN